MNDDSQIWLVNNGYGFGLDATPGSGLRPGNKPTGPLRPRWRARPQAQALLEQRRRNVGGHRVEPGTET